MKNEGRMGSLNSFTAGFNVDLKLQENFSLLCELDYITKGSVTKANFAFLGAGFTYEESLKINYLELPLLAKFSFPVTKGKIYLMVGPSFAYALSGRSSLTTNIDSLFGFSGNTYTLKESIDFKRDNVNRFDCAANFGVGFSFLAGACRINPEFRYQIGLINLNTEKAVDEEEYRVTTTCIVISVGISFPFHSGSNNAHAN